MGRILFSVLFLSIALNGQGQNAKIVVKDIQKMILVGKQTYFLEDPSGKLTLNAILKQENQQKFQQLGQDVFNHPATESVFWFRFTIRNQSRKDLWLKVGDMLTIWYADFYTPDARGNYGPPQLMGALRTRSNKAFPTSSSFYAQLRDKSDEELWTYYLKVIGKSPKKHIFQLSTAQEIHKKSYADTLVINIFVGFLSAISLYSLFLYFSIKDKAYLFYVFFLLSVLLVTPFISGIPLFYHVFLWKYTLVWISSIAFFASLFAIRYFNLRQSAPISYQLIVASMCLLAFFPIANLVIPQKLAFLINLYQPVIFMCFLLLLGTGIWLWRKGHQEARIYVLGWSLSILGLLVTIFRLNGIVPVNCLTQYSEPISVMLETLIFSIALGNRWNALKKTNEQNQQKMLQLITEQNEVLEQKVKEKTKDLQNINEKLAHSVKEKEILLKEVHHRVKNNLQIISSLLNLQGEFNQQQDLQSLLKQSQHKIQTMAIIHEKLYQSDSLTFIDLKSYLESLIQYFKDSYDLTNQNIDFEIQMDEITLKMDHLVPCGLIINELVTNSLKYAFPHQTSGQINIKAIQQGEMCVLTIRDNGIGLPTKFTLGDINSLGLRLVKGLTSQLRGSFELLKGEGTGFKITFSI